MKTTTDAQRAIHAATAALLDLPPYDEQTIEQKRAAVALSAASLDVLERGETSPATVALLRAAHARKVARLALDETLPAVPEVFDPLPGLPGPSPDFEARMLALMPADDEGER
jgi:hypothetical protein